MVKVIGVRFRNAGKIYYFDPLDMDIEVGNKRTKKKKKTHLRSVLKRLQNINYR